jgi:hypothetical protein
MSAFVDSATCVVTNVDPVRPPVISSSGEPARISLAAHTSFASGWTESSFTSSSPE